MNEMCKEYWRNDTNRKLCPIYTLSTTNPTWTCLKLNYASMANDWHLTTCAMAWPKSNVKTEFNEMGMEVYTILLN